MFDPTMNLGLPFFDKDMTEKWFVLTIGEPAGRAWVLRNDYEGLDVPENDFDYSEFEFHSEDEAHMHAAAWYHDTGRNYPYRREWKACATRPNNIWVPDDGEPKVMEF